MGEKEFFNTYRVCFNLIRFMMAENPNTSEATIGVVKGSQGLKEITNGGNWAVSIDYGHDLINYIIVKDGNPCTMDYLPEWANDYPMKYLYAQQDKNQNELLELLKANIVKLKEGHLISEFNFEYLLKSIMQYYELPMVQITETIIIQDLCGLAVQYSYVDFIRKGKEKILKEYNSMSVAGDAVIIPLCVVMFLEKYENNQMLYDLSKTFNHFIKNINHNFILNHNVSIMTVKTLFESGNYLKSYAQEQYTMFQFHKFLYESLLYFRSAHFLGSLLVKNGVREQALDSIIYMCEEMRVIIELSIIPIYREGIPDFFIPENFFKWLGVLDDECNLCLPLTRKQIHSMYINLKYPKIYKDVALVIYQINRKGNSCIGKLKDLVKSMEERKEDFVNMLEYDVIVVLNNYIKIVEGIR